MTSTYEGIETNRFINESSKPIAISDTSKNEIDYDTKHNIVNSVQPDQSGNTQNINDMANMPSGFVSTQNHIPEPLNMNNGVELSPSFPVLEGAEEPLIQSMTEEQKIQIDEPSFDAFNIGTQPDIMLNSEISEMQVDDNGQRIPLNPFDMPKLESAISEPSEINEGLFNIPTEVPNSVDIGTDQSVDLSGTLSNEPQLQLYDTNSEMVFQTETDNQFIQPAIEPASAENPKIQPIETVNPNVQPDLKTQLDVITKTAEMLEGATINLREQIEEVKRTLANDDLEVQNALDSAQKQLDNVDLTNSFNTSELNNKMLR